MNNVTEMKANEFDGIPADEMTADTRRKAIVAELTRLGFDDPEGFLDGEPGSRITDDENVGLDDWVYDTLDNGWDDLCDSVDDEHITTGEDWIRDEEEWWASTGNIWARYIKPCKHKDGSCDAFVRLGELYDWEPDMAYIKNIPIEFSWDSPFGESYDRVEKIFAKYARLFELEKADENYCLAWDAMVADCVHGKNDILDEIAFCAVLIEPGMWDDDKFNAMWQDDAKWNYNCRKYGV